MFLGLLCPLRSRFVPHKKEVLVLLIVPILHVTMTPSVFPDTVSDNDIEAEAEASEARQRGTELIREHLRSHLAQNPSSSYVTWIATLHPENATVQIDPRFLKPDNPWLTVYEETKFYNGGGGDATIHADAVINEQEQTRTYAGFLDLIVGMAIALAGALSTFMIELSALLVHYMANFFEGLASLSSHYAWSKYSFGLLFLLLEKVLRLVEYILLFASIMIIEILAAVSWLICGLLAMSSQVALAAHQRTRRLSHFTRWASRRRFFKDHREAAQEEMVPEGTIAIPTATVVAINDDNNIQSATVLAIDNHETGKG